MKSEQRGFTIIELLIAITVLSVLLLLATVTISGIGNLYYKGVTQTKVQSNARSISKQVAQDIQFSGGNISSGAGYYCVGSVRYSYIVKNKLGDNSYLHILWRDVPGTCPNSSANLKLVTPSSGSELIGSGMALANFSIDSTSTNGVIGVNVGVAYGDPTDTDLYTTTDPIQCKGGAGQQFCSVSQLNTVVVQRVKN